MDILDIDALSFAGRTAHVASAEIYGMLEHGEVRPIVDWFSPSGSELEPELVEGSIAAMAGYVLHRRCSGETLFHFAQPGQDWPGQSYARRTAYDLFAATIASVGSKLLDEQRKAEEALELATRPTSTVLLEDTIFEPEEGLGTQRPEAVAAQKGIADYDQLRKAEARARRKAADAQRRAAKAAQERDKLSADLAAAGQPAPMSIGEAPPAAPVNKGGRGRKKAD